MLLIHSAAIAWLLSAGTPTSMPGMNAAAPFRADTSTSGDTAGLQFPDTSNYSSPGGGIPIEYYSIAQPTQVPGSHPSTKAPVHVLFIGNSSIFENMMPMMFHDLMENNGHPCVVGMVTMGGATLQDLWDAKRAEKVIRAYPWDYVVMQEKTGGDTTDFMKYAKLFQHEIAAKHAHTFLYPQYYQNTSMQHAVNDANFAVAKAIKAKVVPIWAVWDNAFAADPKLKLFENDGFHPNPRGAYLNAWMMYHMITGESPVGKATAVNPRVLPRAIPDSVAATLQQAAAATAH